MPRGNKNKPIKAEPLKETLRGDWEYKTILSKKDGIDEIMKMRVEYGWTRMHIREHLTKEWKLTDSQADDYMKIAAAEFDRLAVQEFSKDLREDVERFESLYEKAVKAGHITAAHKILAEVSKLKGHYIERIDMNITDFTARFPGLYDGKTTE
jgi:hypothetical protein